MYTERIAQHPPVVPPRHFSGVQPDPFGSSAAGPAAPAMPDATPPSCRGGYVVRQQQSSWTGVSACVTEMRGDGPLHVRFGAGETRLFVVLEAVGGSIEIRSKTRRGRATSHDAAHPLSLIPAGLEAHGQATGIRFIRHLLLQLDGRTLAHMADDEIDLTNAFAPRLMFSNPDIMHLAQLFAEECARHEPKSRLYGDTLSVALLLALSRLDPLKDRSNRAGQLAPWQIRRVTEYLAAHLSDDIQLQTVSDLVKLSRSYFSRAFKISTGHAPHQWLLQARIAKAKELLVEGDLPLAQIAVDIGFADQAHFTRTFGRVVGQTPRTWQRTRCA